MKWENVEIELLLSGKIPPNRTPKAARGRCGLLHIPLTGELLNIDMTPNKYNKEYTKEDLELLTNNIAPNGWSYDLCRYVCRTRLNKKFLPKSMARHCHIIDRAKTILNRLHNGETQKSVAESMGISHQRIAQILKHYQKINKR